MADSFFPTAQDKIQYSLHFDEKDCADCRENEDHSECDINCLRCDMWLVSGLSPLSFAYQENMFLGVILNPTSSPYIEGLKRPPKV